MRINLFTDGKDAAKKRLLFDEATQKEDKYRMLHGNFINNTNLKAAYHRINHQIDLALQSTENDLQSKRNVLKAKLLEDEACLTQEYIKLAQEYADKLYNEKKLKAEAIVEAYEKDRLNYVQEMFDRQKILNCEELREKMSSDRRKMLVKAHELQMREKEKLKQMEKVNDNFYGSLMNQTDNYSFDNALKRQMFIDRFELDEYLKMQISAHQLCKAEMDSMKAEELRARKKYEESLIVDHKSEWMKSEEIKRHNKEILFNQIQLNNELKMKRKLWEDEMDNIFMEDLKKEMQENRQSEMEEKKNLAKELMDFAAAWRASNDLQKSQEREDDMIIATINREKTEKMRKFKMEVNEGRNQVAKEVMSYWGDQLQMKQERIQKEKDIAKAEQTIYETCNVDIDESRLRQKREDAKKLQDQLKEQMAYKKLREKREAQNRFNFEKYLLDKSLAASKDCVNMDRSFDKHYHPFYKKLCLPTIKR